MENGSRQWKKYNRAKVYILGKSARQLNDAVHKTTRQFVKWCIENEVKEMVISQVEGVQRHNKKEKRNLVNQKQMSLTVFPFSSASLLIDNCDNLSQ